MADAVLTVNDLRVEFPTPTEVVKAVDGISLQLERGQTLGIVGESGSGKSVTALALIQLVPSPGQVVAGKIAYHPTGGGAVYLSELPAKKLTTYRGGVISMVFQEPMSSLNPVFSIGFQLVEALRQHQTLTTGAAQQQALALLQEVKLIPPDQELREHYWAERGGKPEPEKDLDPAVAAFLDQQKQSFLNRYPHQLSGGQIQRVMIAMAISCNPAILIADEPTTALDVTVQATILDLLRELRDRRQMSIIFVTHDLGIIAEIADQVAVMYRGKIVETGTTRQIFSQPQHPYTRGLLACRPQLERQYRILPMVSDFLTPESDSTPEIVNDVINTVEFAEVSLSEQSERLQQLTSQTPLLDVQNLRVLFPVKGMFGQTARYLAAVNDVSFQVFPGETLGLVGESGCGKTTLGRALLQLVTPSSGQIWFDGMNVLQLGTQALRRLRRDMQIIFQDPYSSLDPRMRVGAAVMEPLKLHQKQLSAKKLRERVMYLLERVGLPTQIYNRYPHEFSGGQRQRICIARALALNPRLIICDESVSALDVSVQAQVLNLLKELQAEFNLTYIFISHDLSVVKFMSDRIMVMNRGKIEEIGPAMTIYQQPQTAYTQQLIAAIPAGVPA